MKSTLTHNGERYVLTVREGGEVFQWEFDSAEAVAAHCRIHGIPLPAR